MFLFLTVADLTSQFTAGTALLGPRVAELRGRSRGTNLFHFWRPDLGGEAGGMDGITDSMEVSLSELWELVMDREAWRRGTPGSSLRSPAEGEFGHRVLLKCGPGNWGLSACCTSH